jgi:PAS domain S-box-containing protein
MTDPVHDEASRKVAETKRRLEGIVDSAMDAIITIDERHDIILFNPAAERMFGVIRDEAIGQPISRFIPARFREGHDEHIRRFRKTGVTARRMGALGAISGLRADGEEFPIEASISQTEVSGEQLSTVILRDITERRANEEARLMLAREVDHRAKNALAVVQSLVTLTDAPTKEAFVTAIRGRISALARAHSLLAQNRWQGAELARIIEEETGPYQKPGQIRCTGPEVMLEPNAVQPVSLIVHELATNAVKYGALSIPRGHIDVAWDVRPDGELRLVWKESGGPPVGKPRTSGFGSTLITTVGGQQLGGRIDIEWPRDGVRFTAELPPNGFHLVRQDEVDDEPREIASPPQKEGRLLLVEDEALVALELARAFQDCGWEVIGPAATLEEGFRLLKSEGPPDVAVLDVNLNGEMVYPLADALTNRGVPFIFCSGYETLEQAARFEASPVVRKPTSFARLMTELRRILRPPPAAPGVLPT